MHILLVEDDALLADGQAAGLRLGGHDVRVAGSAAAALAALREGLPDLLLLDLGLPDGDGLALLDTVRGLCPDLLVIILTARDGLRDRVRGLDAGADDYLIKPVALVELEARLRALARRRFDARASEGLRHGALYLDLDRHVATLAGAELALTPREWSLLELFLRHPGELISKDRLLTLCSGWEADLTPNAIEVSMSRLRGKLEPAVSIRTVRGYGYVLDAAGDEA